MSALPKLLDMYEYNKLIWKLLRSELYMFHNVFNDV